MSSVGVQRVGAMVVGGLIAVIVVALLNPTDDAATGLRVGGAWAVAAIVALAAALSWSVRDAPDVEQSAPLAACTNALAGGAIIFAAFAMLATFGLLAS